MGRGDLEEMFSMREPGVRLGKTGGVLTVSSATYSSHELGTKKRPLSSRKTNSHIHRGRRRDISTITSHGGVHRAGGSADHQCELVFCPGKK